MGPPCSIASSDCQAYYSSVQQLHKLLGGSPYCSCDPGNDVSLGGKLGLDVLQVRLRDEFLVEYYIKGMHKIARMIFRGGQKDGAGSIMLYYSLCKVHKNILFWGKRGPM